MKNDSVYYNLYTPEERMKIIQAAGCTIEPEPFLPERCRNNKELRTTRPKKSVHHGRYNYRINEKGNVEVMNLAAYWIPDICIRKEIGGTMYTVTGSYEGTEMLNRKMLRIMGQNMEDDK